MVIFIILGFGLNKISSPGLVVLVCLANFFCGFGPNTTSFVYPGEVFPTRYRSTSHGISAASGKIGAIISQALIGPLRNKGGPDAFLNRVMLIFAALMYIISPIKLSERRRFLGILITLLLPETKRRTLEDLSGQIAFEKSNIAGELSYMYISSPKRSRPQASTTSVENSSAGTK